MKNLYGMATMEKMGEELEACAYYLYRLTLVSEGYYDQHNHSGMMAIP